MLDEFDMRGEHGFCSICAFDLLEINFLFKAFFVTIFLPLALASSRFPIFGRISPPTLFFIFLLSMRPCQMINHIKQKHKKHDRKIGAHNETA